MAFEAPVYAIELLTSKICRKKLQLNLHVFHWYSLSGVCCEFSMCKTCGANKQKID